MSGTKVESRKMPSAISLILVSMTFLHALDGWPSTGLVRGCDGQQLDLIVHMCVIEIERACQYDYTCSCIEINMTRTYNLKRRAEQQAETRRRIVEAAVELHGSVGPALTTVSMVAERAGVQRHTLYAHFPDERSLFLACSGLAQERDPLPEAEPWRTIEDRNERLRVGLQAIYDWYGRNAELAACVLRDAEYHSLTKEIIDDADGAVYDGLSGGAGREVEHEAARGVAAGAELFHVADAGARTAASDRVLHVGAMVQAIDGAK